MDTVVWTFLLAFGLAFAESGLGLGMVIPGETAIVVIAATFDSWSQLAILAVCVTLGASLGDHVGYGLGLRYGDRLRDSAVIGRLGRRHFDRATDLLRRHGGSAVFLTRLVPLVRTLTPAAAGASQLPYRRFLPASLTGSATWATVYVGGGSVLGAVGDFAHDTLGRASWLALVLLVIVLLPVLVLRSVVGVRPATAAPEVETYEVSRDRRLRRRSMTALTGEFRVEPVREPVLVNR